MSWLRVVSGLVRSVRARSLSRASVGGWGAVGGGTARRPWAMARMARGWCDTKRPADDDSIPNLQGRIRELQQTRPVLREEDVEEQFVRGTGAGGQKVNKTSSCVMLRHLPTGIVVRCQELRSQALNRARARELLREKLDWMVRGEASELAQRVAKIRARKRKRQQRVIKKYFKSRRDRAALSE